MLKVGAFLELPLGRAEQVKRAYAGLQTALVYLSNKYPLTQPDEAYKHGICKFNYIAVPLIVRGYMDLRDIAEGTVLVFVSKLFLGMGIQLAYLLGGETAYCTEQDDVTAYKTVKWTDIKKKNAACEARFLVDWGFDILDLFQFSIEVTRRLNPLVGCRNGEADLWSYRFCISFNLAKFL